MSGTLHVVALPHTQTTADWATCAYTQKIRKFCKMMTGRGRRVVLYAGEENDAPCDEHVVVVPGRRRQAHFGAHDEADLNRGGFDWNFNSAWWREMNTAAAGAVRARAEPHDLLLLSAGQAQQLVADACPAMTVAEFGVGYEGILNVAGASPRRGGPAYSAFESYAHMHQVYRRFDLNNRMDERWWDAVIPNFFDVAEFPPLDRAAKRRVARRGEYLLFVGRLIVTKGPHIAARIAAELDMPLVVAGPGASVHAPGVVVGSAGTPDMVAVRCPKLEFVGPVGIRDRAELMAGAACVLAPTLYTEPFGGVAVEAMMAGTPAVTTDHGAFTETVQEGVSGYRFRTLLEGVEAVEAAMQLNGQSVRAYARGRYSLEAVAPLYDRWFDRLDMLWGKGWDDLTARRALDVAA